MYETIELLDGRRVYPCYVCGQATDIEVADAPPMLWEKMLCDDCEAWRRDEEEEAPDGD